MVGPRGASAGRPAASSCSSRSQPLIWCAASDQRRTPRRAMPRRGHAVGPSLSLMVPAVVSTLLCGPRSGLRARPAKLPAMRCSHDLRGVETGRGMPTESGEERMYARRAARLNCPQIGIGPGREPGAYWNAQAIAVGQCLRPVSATVRAWPQVAQVGSPGRRPHSPMLPARRRRTGCDGRHIACPALPSHGMARISRPEGRRL